VTYWGLWEDSQILKEVIADFESKNPTIKIDYRKQSHRDYRERLQQAILSGNGPDIFRYHVAWVPMLGNDLSAMPTSVMSLAQYKETFYPTAYNNLQVGGQIVGIPLMYDGLALFYNKEMLKTANIEVPRTWAELRTAANKLTVPANVSERNNLTRAGLAIGNAGNVDHFADILALLIIQNGGNPAEATSQYVKDALTFYTNFIKQDKVWSDRLANSTVAFARGDVAMIFAPSWRVHDIKAINPALDFAVTGVPQLDANNPVTWASFWAEGVSAKSKNKDAAWAFLKYLSTPDVLRKFYNDASQYRAFGEIYPRVDMASELQSSELVGAFVSDAPLAKSWYMSSFTHDNGINDQIIKYYEDAINTVLSSSDMTKALETAKTGINTVLSKYATAK
jgi:multiple sugar transport system substrate-binding protein